VVAILAAERGQKSSLSAVDLRRASIGCLYFIAGYPIPKPEAHVAETVARMRRDPADEGELPNRSWPPPPPFCGKSLSKSATTWPACATGLY